MKRLFLLLLFVLGTTCAFAKEEIVDEFVERTLKGNTQYQELAPLYVKPVELLRAKDNTLYEGKMVDFIVAKDYEIDGVTVVKEGEKVLGRIELVNRRAFLGPADLIVSNFVFVKNKKKINGSISSLNQKKIVWLEPLSKYDEIINPWSLVRGGRSRIFDKGMYPLWYVNNTKQ